MEENIGKLPSGLRIVRVTAKVHTVPRYKGPVVLQDEGLQLPVFPTCFPHPDNMRAFHETATVGDCNQIQTQTFINQKFHHALSPC